MITITNDVTFIENGPSANAVKITGGEKYHTHTRAVSSILQSVDKKARFEFSYLSPTKDSPEGKIQFVIIDATDSIVAGSDEEFQIYTRFAQKLRELLDNAIAFHQFYDKQDYDEAIKLNKKHSGKLEMIAKQLSIIERDLKLVFSTDDTNKIDPISAPRLTKHRPLTTTKKCKKQGILLDCFEKHNKSKQASVSLIDVKSSKKIGKDIIISEELRTYAWKAYVDGTIVDITVRNKEKVTNSDNKLCGEIIELENSRDLIQQTVEYEEF